MKKYFLLIVVAALGLEAAQAQNVFNPADAVNNPPGTPAAPPNGTMAKWWRTKNIGRIPWNDTEYKCYIWNGMAYRLRFPTNYVAGQKYPIVVFFHGAGEAGNTIYENEDQLFWGAQFFAQNMSSSAGAFNGFLLFPQQLQSQAGGWDNTYFIPVNQVLDTLVRYGYVDPTRLIAMGLSEGGNGAIVYANKYPRRTASVVASSPSFAGTLVQPSKDSSLQIPMWVANGGRDNRPTPTEVGTLSDQFQFAGGNLYHTYTGTIGHGTWIQQWIQRNAYDNLILLDYWKNASKANPLVEYGKTQFCAGANDSTYLTVTPHYFAYQWQVDTTGTFQDIVGATTNRYKVKRPGKYRVRFQYLSPVNGNTNTVLWSDWSPNPAAITTKVCSPDTLFAEHFTWDAPYLHTAPGNIYKEGNGDCQNSSPVNSTGNGTDDNPTGDQTKNLTNDAAGVIGGKFWVSLTLGNHSDFIDGHAITCTYGPGSDRFWGTDNNQPAVQTFTNYIFSYSIANASDGTPLAKVVPNINGFDLISSPAAPNNFSTPQPTGSGDNSWTKYSYIWNSQFDHEAQLFLKNNNTGSTGNDFAIDEISFTKLLGPGNIVNNMKMWLKAGNVPGVDNDKIQIWNNVAGNTGLFQTNPTNLPQLKNNAINNVNFNPVVSFNTTNNQNIFAKSGYLGTTSHTAVHMFVVATTGNLGQNSDIVLETAASSTRVALSLSNSGNVIWRSGVNDGTHNVIGAGVNELNKPILWSCSKDDVNNTPNGNKTDLRKNGVVVGFNGNTGAFTGNSGNLQLGGNFDGTIAEIVYYTDVAMTAASQNKIESYLATKYGLTLGDPSSAATRINYTAASGTTFWTGDATYQNDVFGIGTDDASGLRLFQSNSANTGSGDGTGQSGKGNIILYTANATFLPDQQFLMIGDDGVVLTEVPISSGAPVAAIGGKRINGNWKVQKTGSVGLVNICFDIAGLTVSGGAALTNYGIMIDSDGDAGNGYSQGGTSIIYASSISGTKVYFRNISFSAANSVFTFITMRSPSDPLPANWLSFTADAVDGKALLNWKTSDEINVGYYRVEQSDNGVDFTAIGDVTANNTTGINNYSLTTQLLPSGVHYYRIRRVDRDGQYQFSVIKTIRINAARPIVEIKPNPVRGLNLVMGISTQQSTPAQIYVVTMDGKRLLQQNTNLLQGVNTVNVNITNVPAGIYMVQLQFNSEVVSKKFVRL